MKPSSHWLNCWGAPGAPASPPPQKPSASGSALMAVCPKMAWGELRLFNLCAMPQECFLLPDHSSEIINVVFNLAHQTAGIFALAY